VESLDDLVCRDDSVGLLAARSEQIREQRLENGEAFRNDRPGGSFPEAVLPWGRGGRR